MSKYHIFWTSFVKHNQWCIKPLLESINLLHSMPPHTRRGKCKISRVINRNTHIKQHWPEIVKTEFKFVGFDLSVWLSIRCESSSHIGLSRCQVSERSRIPTGEGRKGFFRICYASATSFFTYGTAEGWGGVIWADHFYYADISPILPWKLVISHIIT